MYSVKIKGLNIKQTYASGGFSNVNIGAVSITPNPDGATWAVVVDGKLLVDTDTPFDVLREHINKKLRSALTM